MSLRRRPANGFDGLHSVACLRLDQEDHRVVAESIAQPTFYVHFRDKDDLLRTLATEPIGALRARLREARLGVLAGRGALAVRATFRLSLGPKGPGSNILHEEVQDREPWGCDEYLAPGHAWPL